MCYNVFVFVYRKGIDMKALVLAGSCVQVVLLELLKARGIETVLADNNVNAIARPYADHFVKVDLLNCEAVKQVAIEQQVDFLITVCADQVLITVAKVSEELGLPCYIDYQTAVDVSDKSLMKDIFHKNGIPTSKNVFMSELDLARIADMSYPLVVKPADAYSSKGVRKVTNEEELRQFFAEAAQISRSGLVIVEEYVDGAEITVDFQVVDGVAYLLSASNTEKVDYKDRFVPFRTRYPAAISADTLERIRVIGQKIADAFGLKNSPMLVQLLTNDKQESVLEFCARNGGGAKYALIRFASGFDPIDGVIRLTLGEPVTVVPTPPRHKYFVNEFLYGYPGVFDHLEGFEELKQEGVLNEYWQFKWPGAEIIQAISSGDRIAGINIIADSFEELVAKHNKAAATIRAISRDGEDMLRHDLLTPLGDLSL